MTAGRTKRMHTVPEGYFEAFAVDDPSRERSGIWRFGRNGDKPKLLGLGDVEVVRDIYTIYREDGTPDIGIEDEVFCGIEGAFCSVRDELLGRTLLSKSHWTNLARFIAAQLLRTPRVLRLMRNEFSHEGIQHEEDTPQRVMLILIERWITRLVRMRGILAYNDTGLPLLTCDNPAITWKKSGSGFICGVNQFDPDLVVSCPLAPDLAFVAYQTPDSLRAVHAEQYDIDRAKRPIETFGTNVTIGKLPESEVKRLNHICISNAHRYVYAHYSDKPLLNFLRNRFFGLSGPVRQRDLQPIGSPV